MLSITFLLSGAFGKTGKLQSVSMLFKQLLSHICWFKPGITRKSSSCSVGYSNDIDGEYVFNSFDDSVVILGNLIHSRRPNRQK